MNEKLQIIYNPYKKHMSIKRNDGSQYVSFSVESNIASVYNDIVLQNEIEKILTLVGAKYGSINNIEFLGTKNDYNDFKKVAEKFCANIIFDEKFPNGKEAFDKVIEYKNEINDKIKDYKSKPENAINAEKIKVAEEELDKIKTPEINICFIGNYSTGKSSIINALIGRNLLFTSEGSETSKIWRIHMIPEDKAESVNGELVGNDNINDLIKKAKDSESPDVNIEIHFKDSILKSEEFSFIFIDTPGDDNGLNKSHSEILEKCLSLQTGSLPIIITSPEKLETPGFEILSRKILSNRKNIDLSRGLVVINKAEKTTDETHEKNKQSLVQWKKCDNKLPDKVMYLAAIYALKHKCPKEKLGTSSDYSFDPDMEDVIVLPKFNDSDQFVCDGDVLYNTGLRSIENEINKFAEKYAYYNKTNQYAKLVFNVIKQIIEADKNDRTKAMKELKKSLNERADKIVDDMSKSVITISNSIWPSESKAKDELKKLYKEQKKTKDLKDIALEYFNTKIREIERRLEQELRGIVERNYSQMKSTIEQYAMTETQKNKLLNALSTSNSAAYVPSKGVKFSGKFLFIKFPKYDSVIKDANAQIQTIIEGIKRNYLKQLSDTKELFDFLKEKDRCVYDINENDFIKELTNDIESLELIASSLKDFCEEEGKQ